MKRAALVLFTIVMTTATLPAQQPRAPVTSAPTAIGRISGAVVGTDVDATPIRRARVTLTGTAAGPSSVRTAWTDGEGRFAFDGLAAGQYTVVAGKAAYLRAPYGARRHDGAAMPIALGRGEDRRLEPIRMTRGAAISGLVLDRHGLPAIGAMVTALRQSERAGERVLSAVPLPDARSTASVDDRGMYRLYGLPPGTYIVMASPAPDLGLDAWSMDDGARGAIAPTYHPLATSPTDASIVALGAAEERTGIDVSLRLVRTATVEGTVLVPADVSPQSVQLSLFEADAAGGMPIFRPMAMRSAGVGSDGKFLFRGVTPGRYVLSARTMGGAMLVSTSGGRGAMFVGTFTAAAGAGGDTESLPPPPPPPTTMFPGAGRPLEQGPVLWAESDLVVDGAPVNGVALSLQPALSLTGQLRFDGVSNGSIDWTQAVIRVLPGPGGGVMMGLPEARIDPDGRVTISGITPGHFRLSGVLRLGSGPATTTVAMTSAIISGHDVMDLGLHVRPETILTDAVFTFGTPFAEVSGVFQDTDGRASTAVTIVVFASDQRFWLAPSRRVRSARPATDGAFLLQGLPPGSYRLAAVVDATADDLSNPEFLASLVPASIPITLAAGDRKRQDVRMSPQN